MRVSKLNPALGEMLIRTHIVPRHSHSSLCICAFTKSEEVLHTSYLKSLDSSYVVCNSSAFLNFPNMNGGSRPAGAAAAVARLPSGASSPDANHGAADAVAGSARDAYDTRAVREAPATRPAASPGGSSSVLTKVRYGGQFAPITVVPPDKTADSAAAAAVGTGATKAAANAGARRGGGNRRALATSLRSEGGSGDSRAAELGILQQPPAAQVDGGLVEGGGGGG